MNFVGIQHSTLDKVGMPLFYCVQSDERALETLFKQVLPADVDILAYLVDQYFGHF